MPDYPKQEPTEEVLEAEHERLVAEWKSLVGEQELLLSSQEPDNLPRLEQIHNRLQGILDRQWEIQLGIFKQWSDHK